MVEDLGFASVGFESPFAHQIEVPAVVEKSATAARAGEAFGAAGTGKVSSRLSSAPVIGDPHWRV